MPWMFVQSMTSFPKRKVVHCTDAHAPCIQSVITLFMFCMDKKSDAKKRRDDDILSAVLYEQKELQLPRWKQQTTAKGRTTRTEGCRFCSG